MGLIIARVISFFLGLVGVWVVYRGLDMFFSPSSSPFSDLLTVLGGVFFAFFFLRIALSNRYVEAVNKEGIYWFKKRKTGTGDKSD